jgi:Protein of unknown function (DUF2726)
MDSLGFVLIGLLVLLGLAWLVFRKRGAKGPSRDDDSDRLDTVAAWPPKTTRVMTTAERLAYSTLVRALPGYMVLAQVPLARFLKVPTRHSYSEWLRRLGNQCADLVVCDMASEVIAVVNVQPPAAQVSERGRKRLHRMARVLKAAEIPLHVWTDNALPSVDAARETLLPKPETVTVEEARAAAAAAAPKRMTTGPSPLDDDDRDSTQDERIEMRDPTPSTWFDEFNSGPAPLPPPAPPKRSR